MSSMGEQAEPSMTSVRASPDSPVESLAKLQSTLTDMLRPIYEDAQTIDASLEQVHDHVRQIWRAVFDEGGALDASKYKDLHDALETAWEAASDTHEVYAYDLGLFRNREEKDLGVAQADSDRVALVKRRRDYIDKLRTFHSQVSEVVNYLSKPRPSC